MIKRSKSAGAAVDSAETNPDYDPPFIDDSQAAMDSEDDGDKVQENEHPGVSSISLSDRPLGTPGPPVPGEPGVVGSLEREVIVRVVGQHHREVFHCYERELQRNPELEGRVVMTWVIAANGSVVTSSVMETTLNNRNIENCLAQRIRRWNFPKPNGGGIVQVNYPFAFSPD